MRPWGITRLFRFTSRDRRQIGADISDEFTFHLDMRTEDLVREGLDRASAREQALREFGIRLAFGAARADLVRDVLIGAVGLTGVGLLLGLAGAAGVARWMASELYQTRSGDPLVVAGTAATVMAVALLSSWIPAWKASAIEPSEALRAQ